MVVLGTIFWALYGWDSTLEYTIYGSPGSYGYGIHWSTFQTMFLAVWILSINLQVGGVKSLRQLASEIFTDLISVGAEGFILFELATNRAQARKDWTDLRRGYDAYEAVDPLRGFFFALMFALVAGLLFELIYAPLYDFLNFGSVLWPIYYYGNPLFGNPFLSPIFLRNNVALAFSLLFGSVFLYFALDGEKGNLTQRFTIRWRLDRFWILLIVAASAAWAIWIVFPHTKFDPTSLFTNPGAIQSYQGKASALFSTVWSFPSQTYFPQTEYTFYNSSSFLRPYSDSAIFGFWVNDPAVHLINVITKYLTFASVCYPAMIFAERRN